MRKAVGLFFIVCILMVSSCAPKSDNGEMRLPPPSSKTPETRASATMPASTKTIPPEPTKTTDSGAYSSPTPKPSGSEATKTATPVGYSHVPPAGVYDFERAIHIGDVSVIREMLSKNPELINSKDRNGANTPLHAAAYSGHPEVVELLISKGADVNANSSFHITPLHNASGSGNKEIVSILISKGADINAKDKLGETPLLEACKYGRKEIVELLISKGADVNAKAKNGWTPLFMAQKKEEMKALLRKLGAKE